jgi:hypothetical protein
MPAKLDGTAGPPDAEAPCPPEDDERQAAHGDERDERLHEISGVRRHEIGATLSQIDVPPSGV